MSTQVSPNTQAILLLTAPLIVGKKAEAAPILSHAEYNRLARLLREQEYQPMDLIGSNAHAVLDACRSGFAAERLAALLARGFLLGQAVDRWESRGIWVVSRADAHYPRRLKLRLRGEAPPVLYGCGEASLLDRGGLAVVGSRNVHQMLLDYTMEIGALAAEMDIAIVSGAARGIDSAAMGGALAAGGVVIGVMADSLEKAALAAANRGPLREKRLVLISPYDPAAGFNVGHAMGRNKSIYGLSEVALVVNSDYQKGGTWAGAVEQLEEFRSVPIFVKNGADCGKGNRALIERGAQPWPEPHSGHAFLEAMDHIRDLAGREMRQADLSLRLQEDPVDASEEEPATLPEQVTLAAPAPKEKKPETASPSEKLLEAVFSILSEISKGTFTEEQVAAVLNVSKAQAKAWLLELAKNGKLEKRSKPVRYGIPWPSTSLL